MITYNGNDFLQPEIDELRLITEYEGDDLYEFVNNRLYNEETEEWNDDLVRMYRSFCDCGLIAGVDSSFGFTFREITYRCRFLIAEIEHQQKLKDEKDKTKKRFKVKLAIATTLTGGVLAIISSVITVIIQSLYI